ncbi:MAG: ATP-binding protein [Odoribacter sp.]|nr:ATP-binding protein [Odoribacter sp.]
MGKLRMPIGVDDFEKIRKNNFYYVDKTGMIKELLENWGEVNLFTRPRRFGKSINMSMLKYFFEIGTDKSLFDSLEISKEVKLCEEHMGQYPVIAISLKQVTGASFEEAKNNIWDVISEEAIRFSCLLKKEDIEEWDKSRLLDLIDRKRGLDSSLKLLSRLLCKHYGKKVIILIDEYDAPLQKAYENGYYKKMVLLIRQIFGYALKSNEALFFSVLTGCMRVSKESIFSDLNNPTLYTLIDDMCDEWFGFTDDEVRKMLEDLRLSEYYEITKAWYDGYRIGSVGIYCPWDVVNWCRQLMLSSDKEPKNYWVNVSENDIIYKFIEMADDTTKQDLEILSEGGSVDKELSFELTYKDIDSSIENLWSILFTTGYLATQGRNADGTYKLAIPNREILRVFSEQVKKWFLRKIEGGLDDLYKAIDSGKIDEIENHINACMQESISFMDGGNTEEQKESWYHALLVGMMKGCKGWVVKSNREAGNGRADIILTDRIKHKGIIIEVKYAKTLSMLEKRALKGLQQIEDKKYDEYFLGEDITNISKYGIAFNKRSCKVVKNL